MRFCQFLCKAGLLRGDVTPLLDHRLLDLPGVGSRPGAHLLGDIDTLLSGGELRDELGHMLASSLGLQATLFLGGILDHCLGFVVTLLRSLLESTACRSAELPGLLGTASDGGVLLDILLGDRADLLGPLGALGVGGVARGLILTLLLDLSPALDHIVLDVMNLLLGPALRLVFSPADLGALHVAVLDKGSSADLDCLVEGDLLVLYEAALPEVLLTLLLLLGVVVGDIGGVAPLVIRVVALHHVIVLGLLHHLHLVNTLFSVRPRASRSDLPKTHTSSVITLPEGSTLESLAGLVMSAMVLPCMVPVVPPMVPLVEGEGTHQRSLVSEGLGLSQLSSSQDALEGQQKREHFCHFKLCCSAYR